MIDLLTQIAQQENFKLSRFRNLAGGSINDVFLLQTNLGKQVVKINKASKFPGMFEAEKIGLECLKKATKLDVPRVLGLGKIHTTAYLLLEYKETGTPIQGFWENFGEGLAELHRCTASFFGFYSANYIGSLPQFNEKETSASAFYINQRLKPQFRMAAEKGFSFKNLHLFYQNILQEIPDEKPALIHGDLWGGNFLVNKKGLPCLIDPAVCFAPREMDLAMMKIFGGFPSEIFSIYDEKFPLAPGFETRIPLWQLYYLLVHLNIFGSSYLSQVEEIVRNYS